MIKGDVAKIFDIFEAAGYEIKIAGGAVRDFRMRNHNFKDVDFATTALPNQIIDVLKLNGFEYLPIGIEHGTIAARLSDEWFEITTLRKDVVTDGRHAVVEFGVDWEEDAARRDLTINSMFLERDYTIDDYFGGCDDIDNKVIRLTGDPKKRVQEDYLRILRVFRFLSRFDGWSVDPATLMACCINAKGLERISGERMRAELLKIVAGPNSRLAIEWMDALSILKSFDVEIDTEMFNEFPIDADPVCKLFAFRSKGDNNKAFFERIKLSNNEVKQIETVRKVYTTTRNMKKHVGYLLHADKFSVEHVKNALYALNWIGFNDYVDWVASQHFPVSGLDIKEAFGVEGKELGHIMDIAKNLWIENYCNLTKSDICDATHKVLKG